MKALSLKQPWANLITNRLKDIEIRTWNTKFRGYFLVHASKNVDGEVPLGISTEPRGCILAIADLTDVIKYESCNDFMKDEDRHLNANCHDNWLPLYGFVLENVRKINPIPFKGRLNFFETGLKYEEIISNNYHIKPSD